MIFKTMLARKNVIKKIRKSVKCRECGKDFIIQNWRIGKAKYCSPHCFHKGKKYLKSYDKDRICKTCGNKFKPTNWYQKSCSRECFLNAVRKRKTVVCINCKKEFRQIRMEQKFCSRECGKPYHPDIYARKPQTENLDNLWSQIVKARAGGKCEVCGVTKSLNSHHIFSRSNRSVRWDLNNGVCVCVSHHVFGLFSAHKSPIEFSEWLKEKRGIVWYEALREKAKKSVQFTLEDKESIRAEFRNLYKR